MKRKQLVCQQERLEMQSPKIQRLVDLEESTLEVQKPMKTLQQGQINSFTSRPLLMLMNILTTMLETPSPHRGTQELLHWGFGGCGLTLARAHI